MKEQWKIVPEYPNYKVSDQGRIINTKTGKYLSPKGAHMSVRPHQVVLYATEDRAIKSGTVSSDQSNPGYVKMYDGTIVPQHNVVTLQELAVALLGESRESIGDLVNEAMECIACG